MTHVYTGKKAVLAHFFASVNVVLMCYTNLNFLKVVLMKFGILSNVLHKLRTQLVIQEG